MTAKAPQPGELDAIETASRDEICCAAIAAPQVVAATRL